MAEGKVIVHEDPILGSGPDEDTSELSASEDNSDTGSVLSDDSVLPNYEREETSKVSASPLYQACAKNNATTLRRVLEKGVMQEEVMDLDVNGRNCLMLAVSKGFVDIVYGLNQCPYLDINQQDNDGNTALMIAAQAGFAIILTYILNFFSGVDMELRDNRGFTALIKAAMQGSDDCVAALLMAGADLNVTTRGKDIREWALKTGRFETLYRLRRLNNRPQAEQFCEKYVVEWPDLKELVAKASATKTTGQKVAHRLKTTFTFNFPHDPQDNGIMDHMVRMTTGVHSPLVVTGCRPLCPLSPPEIGKRRLAVPDLMLLHPDKNLEDHVTDHSNSSVSTSSSSLLFSSISLVSEQSDTERRGSMLSLASEGVRKFVPPSISRRNSIFPADFVPQIKVSKSPQPTPKKDKKNKKPKGHLQPPIWKYKEAKEKKREEAENRKGS